MIFPCLLAVAGCGGSEKDAMQKRLSGLTEQMTRLENVNDRLAERVQALEIQAMNARTAASAPAAAAAPEDTRVLRPQLRVVKVGPPGSAEAAAAEGAEEPGPVEAAAAEPEPKNRPMLRDHGKPPAPAWAKPRANTGAMGQNRGGAPVRKNPQGT